MKIIIVPVAGLLGLLATYLTGDRSVGIVVFVILVAIFYQRREETN